MKSQEKIEEKKQHLGQAKCRHLKIQRAVITGGTNDVDRAKVERKLGFKIKSCVISGNGYKWKVGTIPQRFYNIWWHEN